MEGDLVTLEGDPADGEPLLRPVLRQGRLVAPLPTLAQARAHAATELARLPAPLRRLEPVSAPYPVSISPPLRDLAHACDERQR